MQKYTYDIPKLTPKEKALPISKYYMDYPLLYPNPLYWKFLNLGAMDPSDEIPVENWLDLLQTYGYGKVEYLLIMSEGSNSRKHLQP